MLIKTLTGILLCLLLTITIYAQSKFTISGYVTEKGSKETLPGATLYFPQLKTGTTSNNYGFYSITLAAQDSLMMVCTFIGFNAQQFTLALDKNIFINIELSSAIDLQEVVVSESRIERVSEQAQMSMIEIPIKQIKEIPALLGEKDVLKVLQLMPGVQKGSEGSSGIYVRGGGADQNLVILDDAIVYNVSHLFGFFSLFNGDALKSVDLIKGGFPARYGSRLSSVIDMTMKDGAKDKLHGEGGIGLISSRLTLEGPILKDRSSFLISARRTYIDILLAPLLNSNGQSNGYFFYDLNAKANYDFNYNNKVYLSGYFGRDKAYGKYSDSFSKNNFGLGWGNATATARWNHLFNPKMFSNTSVIYSRYKFLITQDDTYGNQTFKLRYFSGIQDATLKYDIDYLPNEHHTIKAGMISTYHAFTPSAIVIRDVDQDAESIKKINANENAIYLEDHIRYKQKLQINAGVRFSHFYSQKENYINPEPRLAIAYKYKRGLTFKTSYAKMNQYLHQLSNSGVGLPTDLWVPATGIVKPQSSEQVALGAAHDFKKAPIAITIEGYYKWMNNVLQYKEGASFIEIADPDDAGNTENNWESKVTNGKSWSYGAELLIQKKEGKLTGWIGYTLSWTQMQFDELNFGKKFYARFDRRHDFSAVGIYHLRNLEKDKQGITLSATWVYGTGNAITLPIGTYHVNSHNITPNAVGDIYSNYVSEYTSRNGFRMAPYHRFDIGIQFIKQMKRHVRTWEFSIYNLYNRKNPFFYYISNDYLGTSKLKQITLFPLIPSFSYGFKF
ncbi:MAG: TonB-dependent receptor [Bacteroidetes bacterium]|nr:TonB-dependent receptor [Bacteroidota bacterium]